MPIEVVYGLLLPFAGTALGSACVFFMRDRLSRAVERALVGFAAGVMVAASVWSLLVPAMEESAEAGMGGLSFVPAAVGLWAGMLFLMAIHRVIPHLHVDDDAPEGRASRLGRRTLLVFAVTLHNVPEGMAVGAVLADWMAGGATVSFASTIALALGIAIQNFPEGAIISMPLRAEGASRTRAFLDGVASGVVEPLAGALTVALARVLVPFLPYLLGFAAGAMLYVVVKELVPDMAEADRPDVGVLLFTAGFTLMMALDVALG